MISSETASSSEAPSLSRAAGSMLRRRHGCTIQGKRMKQKAQQSQKLFFYGR
jgi:hypothetical protein